MEIVAILRLLWHRRLLVAVGAVLAIAIGAMVAKRPPSHSGFATTRVVLDTRASQLVLPAPDGVDTLPWRADLLADLMTDDATRARIARALRIRADELLVVEPLLSAPPAPTAQAVRASQAAAATATPYLLTVSFDSRLPVITLAANAPDRAAATRLALAASNVLQASGSPINTPKIQGFAVKRLEPIRAKAIDESRKKVLALGVGVFMIAFGFWCGCLALVVGFLNSRRPGGVRARRSRDAQAAA